MKQAEKRLEELLHVIGTNLDQINACVLLNEGLWIRAANGLCLAMKQHQGSVEIAKAFILMEAVFIKFI